MKVVWPILNHNLLERKKIIMDGLLSAKNGHKILKDAKVDASYKIEEAESMKLMIISHATKEAINIINESKIFANKKENEMIISANNKIMQSIQVVKYNLRSEISILVVYGIKEILNREINNNDHKEILDNLLRKI